MGLPYTAHAQILQYQAAIGVRDQLQDAVAKHRLDARRAALPIANLDSVINGLVELDIQSSEGSLLHETKLRSHLAYLLADIGLTYDRPSVAHYAVSKELSDEAAQGERQLQAAIAAGQALLR